MEWFYIMSSKYSKIIDNTKRGTVVNFLKDSINKNLESGYKSTIDIVSAYFTIYAFQALKEELTKGVAKINFILGEPASVENLGLKNKRSKIFKIDDENISLQNSLVKNKIAKECYEWLKSSNVQIRTAPKKDNKKTLIHGKMYYISQENNPRGIVDALVGSSNFTSNGLGINDCSNYELNTILDSDIAKCELKEWFNDLWENNTEDAKTEILRYIEARYKENSPEIVYLKTLYEIFSDRVFTDFSDEIFEKEFTKTKIWNKLYKFQQDAVKSIVLDKLKHHNGCILADSVGLGKTFTALAVIQYFICNKKPNILVLAPKRLKNNWIKYGQRTDNPFKEDRLKIDFKTHTDLTAENSDIQNFDWGVYDLVVIDESHNFRNATTSKTDENGEIIKFSRYDKLLSEVIKNGSRQPKVLLLSATPVNTSLTDLKNQIRLLTQDKDDAFKDINIPSLTGIIKIANQKYIEWAKDKNRDKNKLIENLPTNFFNLLDAITIARSRKQIKNYYKDDNVMNKIPKRKNPISLYMDIDTMNKFISYEQLNEEIENYKLSLYKPTKYVIRNFDKYKRKSKTSMTQEQRENYLIGMMKIGFLKRLESSIASFTLSMKNTLDKINERLNQIQQAEKTKENYNIVIQEEDISYIYDNDDDFDYNVGKKLVYDIRDLDTEAWKQDLISDREQIKKIYNLALQINAQRDAKLQKLKNIITEKARNNDNKKLLVFSSFGDTANYLYHELADYVKNELKLNIALVTGSGKNECTYGNTNFDEILDNFSPKSKLEDYTRTSKNQIDILICTDCISEGQNLQDCDTVVNYDVHWNPVRLIQRFGRIDRIGSNNKEIQMICFWPTKNLEYYINLQNRVEARMILADQVSVGDDNILAEQNPESEFESQNETSFRIKQMKSIMEGNFEDFEDSKGDISLPDFSLEVFHTDLRTIIEKKQNDMEQLPIGINTIIPNKFIDKDGQEKTIQSGIIFCLKQKRKSDDNQRVNRLQPYYLVYVNDNGTVLYSYEKAQTILNIYRGMCLGKNEPYIELCELFNKKLELENGLEEYNKLLKASVDGISKSYQKDIAKVVFSRGGLIPTIDEQVKCEDDFELVSWLIIDGSNNSNL